MFRFQWVRFSCACRPAICSLVLRSLLKNDIDPVQGPAENFTEVPYGILTNMED